MITAMVLFAVLGIGLTVLRVARRQWSLAVGSLLGTTCAEMGYVGAAMHQPWIDVVATAIGLGGSAVLWILMRRAARSASSQHPLSMRQRASDYRPPAPPDSAPVPPRYLRLTHEAIARGAMLIMPIIMIVAGIVGPQPGPAVFGAIWLPLSLWFVVLRPLLRKRRTATSPRLWRGPQG